MSLVTAQRILAVLLAIVAVAILQVHIASKQIPDPDEVRLAASSFQESKHWQGKASPDFEIKAFDGTTFRLSDHVGREVVILNFFATWCGPCKSEMPEFNRLAGKMRGRPLTLLAIDAEEKRDIVAPFVHAVGVDFAVGIDDTGDILKKYGVDSMPTTVFIGPDGTIRLYQVGAVLNADVAFDSLLTAAFSEIADGKGITREDYLASTRSAEVGPSEGPPARERAARIAAEMACPCGCDQKVAECHCATAKAIRGRLSTDSLEGRRDEEIVRELNREFCVRDGKDAS
jgi:thiol-disulfide isomerase/thioredoxin